MPLRRRRNCGKSVQISCSRERTEVMFAFIRRWGSRHNSAFLTDRWMLILDMKGMSGKKVSYRITPYSNIKEWAVSTAGGCLNRDSNMQVMDPSLYWT